MNKKYLKLIYGIIAALIILSAVILIARFAVKRNSVNKEYSKGSEKEICKVVKANDSELAKTTRNEQNKAEKKAKDSKAEERKKAEAQKKEEEQKKTEQKKAEEQKKADDKKAEEQKKTGDKKATEQKKAEEQKKADDKKAAEQKKTENQKSEALSNNVEQKESSEQTVTVQQPSQPANPKIEPQWLFYKGKTKNGLDSSVEPAINEKIAAWTSFQISDEEMFNWLDVYFNQTLGIQMDYISADGNDSFLVPDLNEFPNHDEYLDEGYDKYCFLGIYTKGEYDDYGNLICYMWDIVVM